MDMGVENHRHHGLAREVHALGACGHLHVGTNRLDRRAAHDDGSFLNRRAAVADDDPRPFERGDRRLAGGWNRPSGKHSSDGCYCHREHSRSAHWSPPSVKAESIQVTYCLSVCRRYQTAASLIPSTDGLAVRELRADEPAGGIPVLHRIETHGDDVAGLEAVRAPAAP